MQRRVQVGRRTPPNVRAVLVRFARTLDKPGRSTAVGRPLVSCRTLVNLASRWTRQRREGCGGSRCRSERAAAVRDRAPFVSPLRPGGVPPFRASGSWWHRLPPNFPGKNNAAAPAATRLRLCLALSEHAVIDTAQMRLAVALFYSSSRHSPWSGKDGTAQVLLPLRKKHSLTRSGFFSPPTVFWHVLFGVSWLTGAQNRQWDKLGEKR